MANPHEVDANGVVVRKNPEADNQAGEPEAVAAVTGRPNDLKRDDRPPALPNSTMASRAAAREATAKAVQVAENKSVSSRTVKRS